VTGPEDQLSLAAAGRRDRFDRHTSLSLRRVEIRAHESLGRANLQATHPPPVQVAPGGRATRTPAPRLVHTFLQAPPPFRLTHEKLPPK
jgi:hypothetical protein